MTSPLCVATSGWCRRVFHYRPPTPMYRNSPPLCTIVLQIPSLMPLKMRKVQLMALRSIPASAGQPRVGLHRSIRPWVYPRECGATLSVASRTSLSTGLSPRVRGNPKKCQTSQLYLGSIPASAGQPIPLGHQRSFPSVYPRECGATSDGQGPGRVGAGLSPRVRGNLPGRAHPCQKRGSIPASAGQPYTSSTRSRERRVYPRECGATARAGDQGVGREGLSPRVRGNQPFDGLPVSMTGSIPASAGQPFC